jgi:hypothetical protein
MVIPLLSKSRRRSSTLAALSKTWHHKQLCLPSRSQPSSDRRWFSSCIQVHKHSQLDCSETGESFRNTWVYGEYATTRPGSYNFDPTPVDTLTTDSMMLSNCTIDYVFAMRIPLQNTVLRLPLGADPTVLQAIAAANVIPSSLTSTSSTNPATSPSSSLSSSTLGSSTVSQSSPFSSASSNTGSTIYSHVFSSSSITVSSSTGSSSNTQTPSSSSATSCSTSAL